MPPHCYWWNRSWTRSHVAPSNRWRGVLLPTLLGLLFPFALSWTRSHVGSRIPSPLRMSQYCCVSLPPSIPVCPLNYCCSIVVGGDLTYRKAAQCWGPPSVVLGSCVIFHNFLGRCCASHSCGNTVVPMHSHLPSCSAIVVTI